MHMKRRQVIDSMRFRLTLTIVAVSVLPLLAVVAILGRWTFENVEQQSLQIQQQAAAEVESEVRSRILEVETQLVLLDEVLALGSLSSNEQESALGGLLSNNRIYQELTLVDTLGQESVRVSRAGVVPGSDLLSRVNADAVTSAIESEDSYFGPVMFDEILRESLMTVAVPLLNRRTGAVESVLIATIRFKEIWDLLGDLAEPGDSPEQLADSEVYVVTDAGVVIAHGNPAVVLSGTEIAFPPSDGRSVGLSGQDAVVATHPLHVGRQELTVVAEQPTSIALLVAHRAREVVVGVTIVALLVAITFGVLAARRLVKPIKRLSDSADKIAAGDLSHRADVKSRGEIGELAESFNTMTAQLSDVIASLEERVAERTDELEEAAAVQGKLILQLEAHAAYDFLTGLPNRYALDSRLEIELVRARRLGSRVAVLVIDLDNFKDVNDTFGHAVGDELLIAVGRRLQETLRDVDAICRLGGDEFAVVQSDIAGRTKAAHLAERLLGAFAESFKLGSQEIFTGASIGVAVSDRDTMSTSGFMQQADLALYRAKSEGRNTYRFFEGSMDTETKRRMSLAQGLRRAIERDELFLEYQPQVGLDDRRIVGVEALLRWRHPKLGIVEPTELVPIAEGAGLIDEVGEWVLRTACMQAQSWRNRNLPAVPVAVNVSAMQLRDPGFVRKASGILVDSELDPQYLELELTETALMEATEHVDRALQTLHELGVRISLDDFGRGYASLDYLRRYPLSKVKIDKSFVHDMLINFKSATIVDAVVDLARKLDLQVIAEGVEPADLLQRLIDVGCEAVQGFYFSRPVSAEDIEELLTIGSDRIQAHQGWEEMASATVMAASGNPEPPDIPTR